MAGIVFSAAWKVYWLTPIYMPQVVDIVYTVNSKFEK